MPELNPSEGQADAGLSGTTGEAPQGESEQSASQDQTTSPGTESAAPESFFDPSNISEELQKPYKEMQAAFTKKMQGFSEHQQKIDAYDAFQSNPQAYLQQLAQQYGYQLMSGKQEGDSFDPTNWDEVMQKAEDRVMQKIAPHLQTMQKSQLEAKLDADCPDWRVYEEPMMKNLQAHPTLVNNPDALYRMSVPPHVLESRATQIALKKLQDKGESAQVSGGSTTTKTATSVPDKNMSFDEAVKYAQASLAEQGINV